MSLATALIATKLSDCAEKIAQIRDHEDRINAFGDYLESLGGRYDRVGEFIANAYSDGHLVLLLRVCNRDPAVIREEIRRLESALGRPTHFVRTEPDRYIHTIAHPDLGLIQVIVYSSGADAIFADALQQAA